MEELPRASSRKVNSCCQSPKAVGLNEAIGFGDESSRCQPERSKRLTTGTNLFRFFGVQPPLPPPRRPIEAPSCVVWFRPPKKK